MRFGMEVFMARKKYVRKPWHLEYETAEAVWEAAIAAAQKGRYPDSRKHFADRLEAVWSKSEMTIANELNRHHLRYDYDWQGCM